MGRLMSVALTEDAVRERRKTVTRRLGWTFLRAGDRLTLCRKVMGRKKGEPLVRIADVEIVSVLREPLLAIEAADVQREGFPAEWSWLDFVHFFCDHMKCKPGVEVTRIEWRYLDAELVAAGAAWLDEHRPGWLARIYLPALDLTSWCCCILGQLYPVMDTWIERDMAGDIMAVASELTGLTLEQMRAMGFAGHVGDPAPFTAAWRELILGRRAEAVLSA